jgi:hypothetical protein
MNKIISAGLQLNLFLNLDHHTTRCYARSAEGVRWQHGDLFYRGSVLKNLVPVEVVIKTRSLSTLSLSQTDT